VVRILTDEELEQIGKFLKREPTNLEKDIFDIMWSERVSYRSSRQWFKEFYTEDEKVIFGIGEGAALIDLGDDVFLSIAMESRNHTTQKDPFHGSAIGVGGIIRDVLSHGCKAIGLMNFLHIETPTKKTSVENLELIVRGISDYGNSVGIPMIGGDTEFDDIFDKACIINLACIGVTESSRIIKGGADTPGHSIVLFGSTTGRDPWAWREMDILKEDPEPKIIGSALSKKILIDTLQELVDESLIDGIQDLGRGGIASAATRLAIKGNTGIEIESDMIPLRESGLTPSELITSRSQERMLAVVDPEKIQRVCEVLDRNNTPYGVIGQVTEERKLTVLESGEIKASLPMNYLVTGFPKFERTIKPIELKSDSMSWFSEPTDHLDVLKRMLSSINICDKSWIYSQFDQHVQTNTLVDIGENAGVIELPKGKRLAFTGDCNSSWCSLDPFTGTANSACESLRNLVAIGAKPILIADCLNFGNLNRNNTYSLFVESVKGLGQFSRDFKLPVVAGSVSFFNEIQTESGFRQIPPTPQIMMAGVLESVITPVRRTLHTPLANIFLLGETFAELNATEYQRVMTGKVSGLPPKYRPERELNSMNAILQSHSAGLIRSCNNIARGGLSIALMKMVINSDFGFKLDLEGIPGSTDSLAKALFSETSARYLAEVSESKQSKFMEIVEENNCEVIELGLTINEPIADFGIFKMNRNDAREYYRSTLPKLINH
jgi:phosphoribosylformylglycinamidine synthase II